VAAEARRRGVLAAEAVKQGRRGDRETIALGKAEEKEPAPGQSSFLSVALSSLSTRQRRQ